MIAVEHYLFLSAFLFCAGIAMVLMKTNIILMLMGVELIFNAANLNLIAFGRNDPNLQGQIFTLFVIMIAACETAVALAIIVNLYRHYKSIDPTQAVELKG